MPFSPGKLAYSKKKAPPRKIKVFPAGRSAKFYSEKITVSIRQIAGICQE